MLRRPTDEEQRAGFTELFFDLVFVLVVTQLSALLVANLSIEGLAKTLFLLLVAWWAWIYTTWTTNWFDPEHTGLRLVLLLGMLASMLGAIAIPDAFGERALLLVIGYVGIQTVRNAYVALATDRADPLHPALVRILVWNAWVGLIWLAGALVGEEARIPIWIVALVADYAGPLAGHWAPGLGRSRPTDWELEPAHFTERIKLFLIIALGESLVAAGLAAGHLELTAARIAALVVAFCITATLWWLYFDYHAERTLEHLRAVRERGRMGRDLTYLHIPIVAGVIVSAVANEIVIAHPDEQLTDRELLAVGGGPVLYLLGSMLFKLRVLHELWQWRGVAALGVAATALLGTQLPALATWSIMLAVLIALAVSERQARRLHAEAARRPSPETAV